MVEVFMCVQWDVELSHSLLSLVVVLGMVSSVQHFSPS